jgi:hypothetical protein
MGESRTGSRWGCFVFLPGPGGGHIGSIMKNRAVEARR